MKSIGIILCFILLLTSCKSSTTREPGYKKNDLVAQHKKIKQIRQYFAANTAPGLIADSADLVYVENYDTNGLLLQKICFINGDTTNIYYNYYNNSNKLSITKLYDYRSHTFVKGYIKLFNSCGHLVLDENFNEVHRYGYRYDSACKVICVIDTFRSGYSYFSRNKEKPYIRVKTFSKSGDITSVVTRWQYEDNGVFIDLDSDTNVYNYTYNNKRNPLHKYSNDKLVASFYYTGFDSVLSIQSNDQVLAGIEVTYYYDSIRKNIGIMESIPPGSCTTIIYNNNGDVKETWHYTSDSFIADPEVIKNNKMYTLYTLSYDYY